MYKDLTIKDQIRLAKCFPKARKRSHEVPPLGEVMPALTKAFASEGTIMETFVDVFGESIRGGFRIVREVVEDEYGKEYADDLWDRFMSPEKE